MAPGQNYQVSTLEKSLRTGVSYVVRQRKRTMSVEPIQKRTMTEKFGIGSKTGS